MKADDIKQWFDSLSAERKRHVVWGAVGGGFLLVLMLVVSSGDSGTKPTPSGQQANKVEYSLLTGQDPKKIGIEQMQADLRRQNAQVEALKRELEGALANGNRSGGSSGPFSYGRGDVNPTLGITTDIQPPTGNVPSGVTPTAAPDAVVSTAIKTDPVQGMPQPGLIRAPATAPMPSGAPLTPIKPYSGNPTPIGVTQNTPPKYVGAAQRDNSDVFRSGSDDAGAQSSPPAEEPRAKLRVLGRATVDSAASADTTPPKAGSIQTVSYNNLQSARPQGAQQQEPDFILPLGSIISGTLLTGMDAPTHQDAKKDPFPALLRIKHEAILPSSGLMDLRECFLVSSGWGDYSSERVYLRAEGISCIRNDGAVLDAQLNAYASGQDGRAGIKGRIVSKTGTMVERSLIAGVLSGVATAFKPQQAQAITLNSTAGTQAFQYPSAEYVAGTGLLSGASNAGQQVANMYAQLAKDTMPVVEIDAGIPVDFIVVKQAVLRFKRVGDVSQPSPQYNNASRAQSGRTTSAPAPYVPNNQQPAISVTPMSQSSTPPTAMAY